MKQRRKADLLRIALKDYEDYRDGYPNVDEKYFKSGFCLYFLAVHELNTYDGLDSDIPELYEIPSDPKYGEYLYELGDIEKRIDHLKRTINYIEEQL